MALCGIAAPLPEATINIASGLALLSFNACAVTLVSGRAKRSTATICGPPSSVDCALKSFSQLSP